MYQFTEYSSSFINPLKYLKKKYFRHAVNLNILRSLHNLLNMYMDTHYVLCCNIYYHKNGH